jgi:AcrR family transcriptional regulator
VSFHAEQADKALTALFSSFQGGVPPLHLSSPTRYNFSAVETVRGVYMRRKHKAIESEILRAAATIFSERGYQATTLDDIAAAAKISRATFYSYFPSKDELLRRMYRQVISSTQAAIEGIASEELPVPEKLRRIIRFLVSYLAAHKPLMQVFFSELFSLPSTMSRSVTQANRAFCDVIERVVEEGVRTKVLIPLNPKRFTYALLGACNWMYRWYRPGGEWTPDAIAEEIIRVLESGYLQQRVESGEDVILHEVRALREEVKQLKLPLRGNLRTMNQGESERALVARQGKGSQGGVSKRMR